MVCVQYEGGEPCAVCGHTLGGQQQVIGPQESVYPTEVPWFSSALFVLLCCT